MNTAAYHKGLERAEAATAELLANQAAHAQEPHLHPEPYLAARWPGRGLRIEIGDRAYACLIFEHRRWRENRDPAAA